MTASYHEIPSTRGTMLLRQGWLTGPHVRPHIAYRLANGGHLTYTTHGFEAKRMASSIRYAVAAERRLLTLTDQRLKCLS
jgi:hypothetical protein